jgi:hypothetical protein
MKMYALPKGRIRTILACMMHLWKKESLRVETGENEGENERLKVRLDLVPVMLIRRYFPLKTWHL